MRPAEGAMHGFLAGRQLSFGLHHELAWVMVRLLVPAHCRSAVVGGRAAVGIRLAKGRAQALA
eukprot:6214569-Prymnesium_polylepis.2